MDCFVFDPGLVCGVWTPSRSLGQRERERREVSPPAYLSGHLRGLLVPPVKDLLVLVHPDLGQAHLVARDHLRALGEGVGALGAEDVSHNGARDDLQLPPALPHLRVKHGEASKRKPFRWFCATE